MTPNSAQLLVLKTDINANTDPTFVGYRNAGNTGAMAAWYNVASTFIIYKPAEQTTKIGDVINYIAVAALTDASVNKLNLFYTTQPDSFEPVKSDQRQYLADVFSGALGGQGQATRDALDALYRRAAWRGEKLYSTGTGTTIAPGDLGPAGVQGDVTNDNIVAALAA